MIVFKEIVALQKHLKRLRLRGKTIGFAPTMGALHDGHMSLIELSNSECDVTVCSIFVNPTQFNEKSDLDKYPVTIKDDLNMLLRHNADIVFLPEADEIYPHGQDYQMPYDLGAIANVLEGAKRPGHFEGVVQVVDTMLEILQPNVLLMGQKDFQQFSIISKMLSLKQSKTRLKVCPIIREKDGLAMSSRNVRLSVKDRLDALKLSSALRYVQSNQKSLKPTELIKKARNLLVDPNIKLEYLEIVDGRTLQPIVDLKNHDFAVVVIAAWVGQIRLIDNIILKQSEEV